MPLDSDYDYERISFCPICGQLEESLCWCERNEEKREKKNNNGGNDNEDN